LTRYIPDGVNQIGEGDLSIQDHFPNAVFNQPAFLVNCFLPGGGSSIPLL
jgi:hypothetical protein